MNQENIVKFHDGFTKYALKLADTPFKAFTAFITSEMLNIIVESTNDYIGNNRPNQECVSMENLLKFIGASLHIGLMKRKNMDVREFWSKKYGQSVIFNSISMTCFERISANLRFDIRNSRLRNDKLAPIRTIWDMFITNCQKHYVPSSQITIDEQLVTFRGRCGFKMYIPNKPGRYGLKIWALCDAKNAYLYNAKVYLGKENGRTEVNQGENVVKNLCTPLFKSG